MSEAPKQLCKAKREAIACLQCDGVPRFFVHGSLVQVKISYSAAYAEIFRMEGGIYEEGLTKDGPPRRVWTPSGIRRITRLNQQYAPFARKVIESQRAAKELLNVTPL